jgi:hypothetical protein
MKKILSLMVLLAGVISFTSCGDDDDATYTAPAQLSLKSADAFYEAVGGTGSIVVNSSETITATSNVEWLTVSVSGNTVNLTVAANDKLEGRSTNVVLKTASASKEVNISQRGIIYGIPEGDAGDNTFTLDDAENAKIVIPVAQTAGMTVTSQAEWLTASFNSETSAIEIVAASNDEEEARTGLVAIETGSIKENLTIVQKAMVFNLEKTNLNVANTGSVEKITIEHSKPVTVESSADWFSCAFDSKKGILTVTVSENQTLARQGTITLKSGKSTKTISVIQYDPASLADQIVGDYYFYFHNKNGNISAFAATLTEDALQIPDYNWSIPVTIDKEKLTVSINSGCFIGKYSSYFLYLLFVDESDAKWSGNSTEVVVTAPLGLEDIGDGVLTLAGNFEGTLASGAKIGSFLFSAFATQELDVTGDGYLGKLLQIYYPGLEKMTEEAEAAPAKVKRAKKMDNNVPFYLKKRFK